MSEVGWRPLKRIGNKIGAEVRHVDRMVTLPGGGSVQVRSADDPVSLRGEGLDLVVPDECAFMKEEAWTEALRPALSDNKGKAIFISTPKGHNWFWRLFMRGVNGEDDWASFNFPTSNNPYIDPEEIEAAQKSLPDRIFRQEYMAEFLDDAGGVFRHVIDAAVMNEINTARESRQYVAGVDIATKVDFTVASVFDVESREMVYMDRFNRIDFDVLEDRLEALYRRFKLNSMTIEQNSIGQPVIEALVGRDLTIIPFTTTNATKQAAIQSLQAAFEHSTIKILNDPVLVGELQAFEGERMPSGAWKYSAPDGMHDDCVMSLAIAWHGLEGGTWDVY
jgi:phage terminase large subunit-like protein